MKKPPIINDVSKSINNNPWIGFNSISSRFMLYNQYMPVYKNFAILIGLYLDKKVINIDFRDILWSSLN